MWLTGNWILVITWQIFTWNCLKRKWKKKSFWDLEMGFWKESRGELHPSKSRRPGGGVIVSEMFTILSHYITFMRTGLTYMWPTRDVKVQRYEDTCEGPGPLQKHNEFELQSSLVDIRQSTGIKVDGVFGRKTQSTPSPVDVSVKILSG
jgi:hypothetical protein